MTSKQSSQTVTIVSPKKNKKKQKEYNRNRPECRSDHIRSDIFPTSTVFKNREVNINNFVNNISFQPRKTNCLKDKKKKKWARIKIPDV